MIKDQVKRFGTKGDVAEIMAHPWWNDIDWKKLEKKEILPPFKPNLAGEKWLQNFDEEFVKEGKNAYSINYKIHTYKHNGLIEECTYR